MKKKNKDGFKVVKCSGCGTREKTVDSNVVSWYCSFCVLGNNNYIKKVYGKRTIKPVKSLRKRDKVLSVNGKRYVIGGKAYIIDGMQFYIALELGVKNPIPTFIGAHQVVKVL